MRTAAKIGSGALVFILGVGCGQPEKPAEAPEAGLGSEADQERTVAEDPSDASTSEDTSAQASESAAPAGKEDVQAILQLVIDDEALSQYLHLELPDRFPLRISGNGVPSDTNLTKATQPVVIVADANDKKPVIVFTDIEVNGDEASVRYRYDVEKLRGSANFKRRDGRWVLTRSRVTER